MKIFWLVLAMAPLTWAEPIIIDTLNTGFKLSSPKPGECVMVHIVGYGNKLAPAGSEPTTVEEPEPA